MVHHMVIQIGHEPDPAKRIRQRQGATIRKIRKMRGLSIQALAEGVDVSPGAVSQWETGRYTPRQDVQVRIAKTLDVPWSMVFGLDADSAA
jgi:transcriptional regulator with XRE-family HTH domain